MERGPQQPKYGYEIRVKKHLDAYWAEWFDGWTITNCDNDEAILSRQPVDHSALHGMLDKIRDLNLTLVSVKRVPVEDAIKKSKWKTKRAEEINHGSIE